MVIRRAELRDADSIVLLIKEMGHQSTAEEVSKRLQRLTNNHVDRVWVCEKDSKVIGFLSFHIWPRFYDWGNQGRITAMAIHSEFRRKGYGRQLIEYAEKFAQESDCFRIEVTSYSYRTETHEFYKALGFTCVKSKRFMKAIVGDLR
jgi:N-acetylglutamate synthase-like GNAT family acetyltransferase